MKNKNDLSKEIPETAREFRLDDLLLKITKSEKGSVGFVVKNTNNPHNHHTFVVDGKNFSLHSTKESDGIHPNLHEEIDYEKFLIVLGKALDEIFSNAKKLSLNDPNYIERKVQVMTGQQLVFEKKTRKKVVFNQDVEGYEANFEDIDLSKKGIGAIFDDNGNEISMIIIQNNEIFEINLDDLESKSDELDRLFRPTV